MEKVLYFHNDPEMKRLQTLKIECFLSSLDKIIFSDWSKSRFIKDLSDKYVYSNKLQVIKQSIDKKKLTYVKKEKLLLLLVN